MGTSGYTEKCPHLIYPYLDEMTCKFTAYSLDIKCQIDCDNIDKRYCYSFKIILDRIKQN